MKPQPDAIATKLIDELNTLSTEQMRNQFVMRRYKKEAEAFIKNDPFSGYLLCGVISALEKNVEEMHRCHQLALKYKESPLGYGNYSVSLGKLGFFKEAFYNAEKAYELAEPAELIPLYSFIIASVALGRINFAQELIEEWNKLKPDNPHGLADFVSDCIPVMEKFSISDNDLEQLRLILGKSISDSNALITQGGFDVIKIPDSESIIFEEELDVAPEIISEIEDNFDVQSSQLPKKLTDTVQVIFPTADPDLDKFLEYAETHMEKNPKDVLEADKKQIDRIAQLIGRRK